MYREITDIEEKTLQVAYFLSRRKGGVSKFSLKNIHRQWCQWWGDDFCVDGRRLKIFHNKIVLSSSAVKRGEEQPEYCKYYTEVLLNAQEKIIKAYHPKMTGRENSNLFRKRLIDCRRNHGKALRKKLKKNGLSNRYYIKHNSYTRYVCKLGRYILHDNTQSKDRYCCIGTYDEMCKYIDDNLVEKK